MNHDEFVGHVQHRAALPSRGEAERIIRVTFETLRDRLQPENAAHLAAQLPPELARHLRGSHQFQHLTLDDFYRRIAVHEGSDTSTAAFHARCVFETLREAITPGAVRKLEHQLPHEFKSLIAREAA
jgi:uncharacterized protein (DUF2267 family)